ncbi:Aminotransferase class I and II/Aminotransferase class-V [Novymonas esmeraldas]|uniref:Aminotransferase class I and II/Aminotransferase class-V n=1 Tax=Novymonas esmeraldas TaxID=1808958 RepID=A0AAW0F2Y0_9TRYP
MPSSEWAVECSAQSGRVYNPIRAIADNAKPSASHKSLIKLSIGDPTLDHGHLPSSLVQQAALQEAVASRQFGGYVPALGIPETRTAIADYWKRHHVNSDALKRHISAENIILTSGGSHGILMAIAGIANPGDNILVPAPGFPHYETVAKAYDVELRFYDLNPDQNWEADMSQIKALRDERTKLIIMTNPSNPCGSNYGREHVESFVRTAEELKLPLFSDEMYAGMVFQTEENPNKEYTSVADIPSDLPRVILCGTAKIFLVPGWRLAWLMFIDPAGHGAEYIRGVKNQALLLVGPSTLAQASVAAALLKTPAEQLTRTVSIIAESAMAFHDAINSSSAAADAKTRMVWATMPQAAMYVMLTINLHHFDPAVVTDDVTFVAALLAEENVQLVPGVAFHAVNCCRVVITRPSALLREAAERIALFCERHRRSSAPESPVPEAEAPAPEEEVKEEVA